MSSGEAERRFRSRWKPATLLYAELDGSNGGVVLDISDTGLAMHAAQIVVQDSISRLRLKLPASRREIVTCGRIAWKGDSHKKLGIRFLDLPESAQLAIREWIEADASPRKGVEKVRQFPLSRLRRPVPPESAAASEHADASAAKSDSKRQLYRISTAIAFSQRETDVAPNPEATGTIRAQCSNGQGKSTERSRQDTPARTPIWTVLPLGHDTQSAFTPVHGQKPLLGDAQPGWSSHVLLAVALLLASFFTGLAAGGRSLSAAVRELSVQIASVWNSTLPKPSLETAVPRGIASTPGISDRGGANIATPHAGEAPGTVLAHSHLRRILGLAALQNAAGGQGDALEVGELVSGELPGYPPEALRRRVEGKVSIRAMIGRDGAIARAEIVRGPALLAAPSLAAVRTWRFAQTILRGRATRWEEDITIVFKLAIPPQPSN